jgi:hypothetical protein
VASAARDCRGAWRLARAGAAPFRVTRLLEVCRAAAGAARRARKRRAGALRACALAAALVLSLCGAAAVAAAEPAAIEG